MHLSFRYATKDRAEFEGMINYVIDEYRKKFPNERWIVEIGPSEFPVPAGGLFMKGLLGSYHFLIQDGGG